MRRFLGLVLAMALAVGPVAAQQRVRDETKLIVEGVQETWRLVWLKTPRSICPATEIAVSATCPCSGWAYGEQGRLAVVRMRKGRQIDRLELGQFFYYAGMPELRRGAAILQRWPEAPDDLERSERGDRKLPAEIAKRPMPRTLDFADYDHDGRATEFLLQVQTLPCGKREYVAVGLLPTTGRLGSLRTAEQPGQALMMPRHAWEALAASSRPEPVLTWDCDDHGSVRRTTQQPSADHGVIHVTNRVFGCQSDGNEGKLLGEYAG
jgi:hypothetical protein